MLGKNIGRKVGANFVNTQYQAFLTESAKKKAAQNAGPAATKVSADGPPKSKEQRREEMRRIGIFVTADSDEMEPTIMEKIESASRPFICPPQTMQVIELLTESS
ncbi:hypothetical protein KIN20_010684 [Parelaphostrongylus tenuis]|uniref:Uncharacterized protein n=1 Tax=Parelaphostrongylus tenuis TaxID=148309 RepID=A0AAD5QIZ6_PARTN|nr:hypothetical protein KIN20_010684 [Parelaphostrongylus tenuis]